MRIVIENPRANGRRARVNVTYPTGLIYVNRISRLDECQHLRDNDPISFHVKVRILADLINPSNIIKNYRLANPATLQNNLN